MSVFTSAELDYLAGQPLGRLATLAADGSPQTRPVGFVYNAELDAIDIGGRDMDISRKYRNVQADPRVSFVVDDLATTDPWYPRGVEIRGRADAVPPGDTGAVIRIHPRRVLSWGIDTDPFAPPRARDAAPADRLIEPTTPTSEGSHP